MKMVDVLYLASPKRRVHSASPRRMVPFYTSDKGTVVFSATVPDYLIYDKNIFIKISFKL